MKRLLYIALLLTIFLLTSCSSEKTTNQTEPSGAVSSNPANVIDQITVGMSSEEVVKILGPADEDLGSGTVIDQYVLNDEEIAIISYEIDSDGAFRVTNIYVGPPVS